MACTDETFAGRLLDAVTSRHRTGEVHKGDTRVADDLVAGVVRDVQHLQRPGPNQFALRSVPDSVVQADPSRVFRGATQTWKTPSGRPASLNASAKRLAQSGVLDDCLSTTALPARPSRSGEQGGVARTR